MKKYGLVYALVLSLIACPIEAQTGNKRKTIADEKSAFEAYKKQKSQDFANYKSQKQREFDEYRRKKNEEFAEYIRKRWQGFNGLKPKPKPKDQDKPPVVIKDEKQREPVKDNPIPIKETVKPPKPEPKPEPIAPIQEETKPAEKWVSFTVFGTGMKVRFDDKQRFKLNGVNEAAIADCWKKLSGKDYDNTLHDCLQLRDSKKLSDWAYLNMLQKMAEQCVGRGNEATLLMAYVYSQSGYQMRLGMTDQTLRMLYACKHTIYGKDYFQLEGRDYYVWNGSENSMKICSVGFPKETPLSLYLPKTQSLAVNATAQRTLTSKRYPQMKAQVSVNKNLIDFYNSYPSSMVGGNFMTRWALYANTPLDATVKKSLYPALRESIKGCNEKEAVERLLNWVQTAFVYEYDEKVWGHDRAFFAEESLFYPYCDCEDRSVLLSRLVRDLLGLKVILVYYPGHLATAIHFANDVKGDYIMLSGQRYTVCDPTYIGASIGMTMPGMDNNKATVILLE